MDKSGINGLPLSHNRRMEQKTQTQNLAPTKENGVFLNAADAEEYRLYKKRKSLTEISSALNRSVSALTGGEDVQRTCERAIRLRQTAIKVPLSKMSQAAYYLSGNSVRLDCVVGGNGETLTKVKRYETRLAIRRHAHEITLRITPSHLDSCRYGEIQREVKNIVRAAGKIGVKVRVEKTYNPTALARLARVASESGARYLSVPYFHGCEKLRLDLTRGCALEVSDVDTLEDYRKLIIAGVGRIVTDRAWEIYGEWLQTLNAPLTQNEPQKTVTEKTPTPAPMHTPTPTPEKKEESTEEPSQEIIPERLPAPNALPPQPLSLTAQIVGANAEENKMKLN
jgi:deoxyribose-phosphate aldolase